MPFHLPSAAKPLPSARANIVSRALAMLPTKPCDYGFSAVDCIARPYENDGSHECGLMRFIALRCAVAVSSLWSPNRNTMPGKIAGTVDFRHVSRDNPEGGNP